MSILSDYKRSKQTDLFGKGLVRQLARELREVLDDDELDWEEKYDLIFSAHQERVKPALKEAYLYLEYYDPDTTYDEDSRAYVEALESLVG